MKSIFSLLFILIAGSPVLADDISSCANLVGDYTCTSDDVTLPFEIKEVDETKITLKLANDSDAFIIDRLQNNSSADDSSYIAMCTRENHLVILNIFNEYVQTMIVSATSTGVNYSLFKPGKKPIELSCSKK